MSRGALAFAWVSSVAVHAVAALLVLHVIPTRTPAPPAKLVYLEALGPGTGFGGEKAAAPAEAPPAMAPPPPPPPPMPATPRTPPPIVAKPRPTPKTPPAAKPAPATASASATAAAHDDATGAGGDGSGPGAGGGSLTGSPLGTAAVPPAVLTRVPPVYPSHARESGVEGAVVLLAIVAEDGRVEEPVRIAR